MLESKLKDIIGKKVFYVEAEDNSNQEARLIGFYLETNGYLKAVLTTKEKEMHVDIINVSEDKDYIDKRIQELLPALEKTKELNTKALADIKVLEDERQELVKPLNDKILKMQSEANAEIAKYRADIIGKTFLQIVVDNI